MHGVGFAVIDHDPVSIEFCASVGTPWVEGSGLSLRCFDDLSKQFRSRCLIKANVLLQLQNSYGLQKTQRSKRVGVGRILRCFKAHLNMALGSKIVDFGGPNLIQQANERG